MTDDYLHSRGVYTAAGKALARELTDTNQDRGWPWHPVLLDDAAYFVDQIADIERQSRDAADRQEDRRSTEC